MLLTASSSMSISRVSFRLCICNRTGAVFIKTCYESYENEYCAIVKTGPILFLRLSRSLKSNGVEYSFRELLYTIKSGRSVVG